MQNLVKKVHQQEKIYIGIRLESKKNIYMKNDDDDDDDAKNVYIFNLLRYKKVESNQNAKRTQ